MLTVDQLQPEELLIIEDAILMKGFLKKKREDSSIIKAISQSNDRYFRFFCQGKFLAYFKQIPVGFFDSGSARRPYKHYIHG